MPRTAAKDHARRTSPRSSTSSSPATSPASGSPTPADEVVTDWNLARFDLAHNTWLAEGERGASWAMPTPATSCAPASSSPTCGCTPSTRNPSCSTDSWGWPNGAAARSPASVPTRRRARRVLHRPRPRQARRAAAAGLRAPPHDLPHGGSTSPGRARPAAHGIEIRPFRVEQAARMRDTMNDAFNDHFRQSQEPFDAWKQRLMEHPASTRTSGSSPGTATRLWALSSASTTGTWPACRGLAVRRAWRRRGVGSALLTRALAACRGTRTVSCGARRGRRGRQHSRCACMSAPACTSPSPTSSP